LIAFPGGVVGPLAGAFYLRAVAEGRNARGALSVYPLDTLTSEFRRLASLLAAAGFIAPDDEARQLLDRAAGDSALLARLVERRLTGEPLAWITGLAVFCDLLIRVDPGVYVPRPHTETLARRAAERLTAHGTAVDLCTGSGAVAKVLGAERPTARIVATDIDVNAVACARTNGVEAFHGDLFEPLPRSLMGQVDVVVAVVPYVPTYELPLLQRDTFTFESQLSYDGGADGTDILRRVLAGAPGFLKRGGAMLAEVGGDQADLLSDDLASLGYTDVSVLSDEDGDVRGIEAMLRRAGA